MTEWIRRYPGRAAALLGVLALSAVFLAQAYFRSPPTFVFLVAATAVVALAVRFKRPGWRRNYLAFVDQMKAREPGTVFVEGTVWGGGLVREAKADRAAHRPTTIDPTRMPGGPSTGDIFTALVAAPSGIELWRLRSFLRGEPIRYASFYWKDIESIGIGKTPWGWTTDTFPLVIARRGGSPITMWPLSRPRSRGMRFRTSPDAATIAQLETIRQKAVSAAQAAATSTP
jgi:hypothetical protein